MMNSVATFEKVSFGQFLQDQNQLRIISEDELRDDEAMRFWRDIYTNIDLPSRSTEGSAGYDFHMPFSAAFRAGRAVEDAVTIPTGIRCRIEPGWMLALFPRSGLGFKHGMRLMNTVGVIDSDYYHADNEGHIMAKICSDANFVANEGDRFMQGVLIPFGVASNDDAAGKPRTGGFGSTGA